MEALLRPKHPLQEMALDLAVAVVASVLEPGVVAVVALKETQEEKETLVPPRAMERRMVSADQLATERVLPFEKKKKVPLQQ